jgi:ribosomal protein S18 acetylase RimI-like enzyme
LLQPGQGQDIFIPKRKSANMPLLIAKQSTGIITNQAVMTNHILLRKALPEDAQQLSELGIETFNDHFAYLYSAEDLNNFLKKAYDPSVMKMEIEHPENHIILAYVNGKLAGYAKSGKSKLPVQQPKHPAYELHRLYVQKFAQRMAVGKTLMKDAMQYFERAGANGIYIGVWSGNERAQQFYRKHGFEKVGEYHFMVGNQADDEWIMQYQRKAG